MPRRELAMGGRPAWTLVLTVALLRSLVVAQDADSALDARIPEPFPEVIQPVPLASGTEYTGGAVDDGPRGSGFWSTKGSMFVDAAGREVYFSGLIWSGFETPDLVVHGLWGRSYASHLDQIHKHGFNMLRLPFCGEGLLAGAAPKNIDYGLNPDLKGLNSLQVMDKIIAGCTERGIKVILDYHRIHATVNNEDGLWWDKDFPPETWVNNWVMLAKRYQGNPTIIGADLFNEVHRCKECPPGAPFWVHHAGPYEAEFNFRTWSYRAANAIHAVERNWIIFLEGLYMNYWWGGNCSAMLHAPLQLPVPNKLAYTSHEYGPYVYWQHFFNASTFPRNLIPLFRANWGKIQEQGIAPVWVGEFGSFYPRTNSAKDYLERTAFRVLIAYIRQIKASWTLAFWGPDSKDTGGVLTEDWKTVDKKKLKLLRPIMHPGFGPSRGQSAGGTSDE